MKKTYMILQGENNNNSDVIYYHETLTEAKSHIMEKYKNEENVFILMMIGQYFGEGFHQYTLELINDKWRKNTRI